MEEVKNKEIVKEGKPFILSTDNIGKKANEVVSILKNHTRENPIARRALSVQLHLTDGQCSRVIKYMRDCARADLEKFIPYYPISSKKGYYFCTKWSDFVPCWYTLVSWANGILKTCAPMEEKMRKEGVDIAEHLKKLQAEKMSEFGDYNYLLNDIEEINAKTSWFLDK